jgi:hypothetical protein
MRHVFGVRLVSLLAVAVAGCGSNASQPASGGGNDAGTPATSDSFAGALPCDVERVLASKCRNCHSASPQFGAPMPLVTLADLHRDAPSVASKKVFDLVASRVSDDAHPMPPAPNARIGSADREVFASWASAGAPAGEGAACGDTTTGSNVPASVTCTPDLHVAPAKSYAMPATSGDDYVCYGVDISRPVPTHVTGFAPRIDNAKIVHHVVLFESDAAYTPTPTRCNPSGSLKWRMVMAWAPGGKGLELPPAAGFPLKTDAEGKTHYVVQMHYSNPQGLANQSDTSGFDLCTSAPRPNEADVLAFGTQSIEIPAGAAAYEKDCSITVPDMIAGTSGIHLLAAMPHMHKLGASMSTTLLAGGPTGPSTDLGTVNNYQFDTQAWVNLNDSIAKKGDVIRTRCVWNNSTKSVVKFGEATTDEMCYSFTVYYPKVKPTTGLPWSWVVPALTSKCK